MWLMLGKRIRRNCTPSTSTLLWRVAKPDRQLFGSCCRFSWPPGFWSFYYRSLESRRRASCWPVSCPGRFPRLGGPRYNRGRRLRAGGHEKRSSCQKAVGRLCHAPEQRAGRWRAIPPDALPQHQPHAVRAVPRHPSRWCWKISFMPPAITPFGALKEQARTRPTWRTRATAACRWWTRAFSRTAGSTTSPAGGTTSR